jgi:hypothetical protein
MTINEIIGNRTEKSRVDTELWKKMNEKYSGIENPKEEETNIESLEKRLKYDIDGKPKLNLISIENTVVNTQTQKEYDTLMQIYDAGEWTSGTGGLATKYNFFSETQKETCIRTKSEFVYDSKEAYKKEERDIEIISTQKFYDIQNIKPEDITELNQYYEREFPNRISKG